MAGVAVNGYGKPVGAAMAVAVVVAAAQAAYDEETEEKHERP